MLLVFFTAIYLDGEFYSAYLVTILTHEMEILLQNIILFVTYSIVTSSRTLTFSYLWGLNFSSMNTTVYGFSECSWVTMHTNDKCT